MLNSHFSGDFELYSSPDIFKLLIREYPCSVVTCLEYEKWKASSGFWTLKRGMKLHPVVVVVVVVAVQLANYNTSRKCLFICFVEKTIPFTYAVVICKPLLEQ